MYKNKFIMFLQRKTKYKKSVERRTSQSCKYKKTTNKKLGKIFTKKLNTTSDCPK